MPWLARRSGLGAGSRGGSDGRRGTSPAGLAPEKFSNYKVSVMSGGSSSAGAAAHGNPGRAGARRRRTPGTAGAPPVDRVAEMLACVRASGLKLTPQRMAIVRELAADPTHPTAQELFERLRAALPTMSFATVYNTLDALASAGLCAALSLAPGPARFDPNMQAHHHAVCDRCGLVRDVPGDEVADRRRARPRPRRRQAAARASRSAWSSASTAASAPTARRPWPGARARREAASAANESFRGAASPAPSP